MKRRQFLKTAGLTTAATIAAPYILPSGRLFAQTGSGLADHVVFVLFAGGVRHQESIGQRYLHDSQFAYTNDPNIEDVEGNIMPNMLTGIAPDKKIVYGMDPVDGGGTPGSLPLPPVLSQPLQEKGVLFKEMTCRTAGHYLGLSALVSGNYAATQGLRQKPLAPTIFEYVRKHLGVPATKTWFIGNGIGNSTPLLNYSVHTDYGAAYGANFFAATTTFGEKGVAFLSNAKSYHPEEELDLVYLMKNFLDNSFLTTGGALPSLGNTPEETYQIKEFMRRVFHEGEADNIINAIPGQARNNDVTTVAYACAVMREFKPTVTVINMSNVDGCHSNFTGYLRALHRADYAAGYLWNFIQNDPVMGGNTALIIAPEHGRNAEPNNIKDFNDWYAYDHSDENALRNFSLMLGPGIPAGLTLGNEGSPLGDTAQCMLTVAEILGIKNQVASQGLLYNSQSLLDLI